MFDILRSFQVDLEIIVFYVSKCDN